MWCSYPMLVSNNSNGLPKHINGNVKYMINYQQHIDDLVSWYVNGVLSNTNVLTEQSALTHYRQPRNTLLMPIVRKHNYRIIRELVSEARLGISLSFNIPHRSEERRV